MRKNNSSSKPQFISFDKVEEFVSQHQSAGKQWSWDGWTLEAFSPLPRARTHRRGVYRNGNWGFVSRISPTSKGYWVFDKALLQ